jgi:hypothetical protein
MVIGESSPMMKMLDCPRSYSCNAAICPFSEGGVHRKGEAVCYYLREAVKPNAKENFESSGVGHIFAELVELAPKVIARSIHIRREVEKASKTKSRLAGSKKIECETPQKGVDGTVTNAGIGNGTAKGTYSPIPPLPVAGNAILARELTGDRNRCTTCLEYFNSSKAFDQHRAGKFNGKRRCLTIGEMETNGFGKNREGFWLSPVSEKDRERLAEIWKGNDKSKTRSEENVCNSYVHFSRHADG